MACDPVAIHPATFGLSVQPETAKITIKSQGSFGVLGLIRLWMSALPIQQRNSGDRHDR